MALPFPVSCVTAPYFISFSLTAAFDVYSFMPLCPQKGLSTENAVKEVLVELSRSTT